MDFIVEQQSFDDAAVARIIGQGALECHQRIAQFHQAVQYGWRDAC
ncbi:hypothetical protein HX857_10950 [Pseudomonas gingeri]|nr:hypothetical protein [Pseudomonas gingeri]